MTVKRLKAAIALVLSVIMLFALVGCGTVEVGTPSGGATLAPETATTAESESQDKTLVLPSAAPKRDTSNKTANLFVSGERSMMGFADWQYDTVYESAVSLLADELNGYSPMFYRYDGYNVGTDVMKIADAAALKANIRNIGFYSSVGIDSESSIPASVKRYKQDKPEALLGVNPWLAADVIMAAGPANAYPLDTAIEGFSKDALNVVVTDLYELRNGSFESLSVLKDYDVGVLAVHSEFSGVLPEFASDGSDLVWGSPMTGSYKSHEVKKVWYYKDDGTQTYYSYNIFAAYEEADRVSEKRTFYILLAGNADQVADVMSKFTLKLTEKYANSATITPEVDSLLLKTSYYNPVSENLKVDTNGAIEYYKLPPEECYIDSYGYEIRSADEKPELTVNADYPIETGASARELSIKDFTTTSEWLKLGENAKEYAGKVPKLSVAKSGSDKLALTLTYDPNGLESGEYVVETHITLLPPEQSSDENAFIERWGISVDDGTLRQWINSYTAEEQDGVDKLRNLMVHTLGLSNIFEPINTTASGSEILAVRLYFYVV